MKQIVPVLLAAGLAVTWSGCQSATETNVDESIAGEFVLVTLDVPNMT